MKELPRLNLKELHKTILYLICGLLIAFVLMYTVRATAGARRLNQKSNQNVSHQEQVQQSSPSVFDSTSGNLHSLVEQRMISEWQAFAVYHPNSGLSEDLLFQNFKRRPTDDSDTKSSITESRVADSNPQVLGSRTLIPILRDAFGVQARGQSAAERDSWFLTHPTSLFSPSQMRALCDSDIESVINTGGEICWKPRLSDEYLSTLTDFASDACPALVTKERSQPNRMSNKLVRSEQIRSQDLRYFALTWLKIPAEKVTDEWLDELLSETKKTISSEFEGHSEENPPEFSSDDLYAAACQSILLSREFYTR